MPAGMFFHEEIFYLVGQTKYFRELKHGANNTIKYYTLVNGEYQRTANSRSEHGLLARARGKLDCKKSILK